LIRINADPDGAAREAARVVAAIVDDALAARGGARIALPGGRTPEALYRHLADPGAALDWSAVDVYLTDERAVPPGDPESNHALIERALALPPARAPRLHRMRADAADAGAAVEEYEAGLAAALDLVVLGMGADGHTASLFPGSPLLAEKTRRVAFVRDSPKPPAIRITILPRVIEEARARLMLVTGADKAAAVARALEGALDPGACPAQLARDGDWFLDRDAAAGISMGGVAT
jgi:6-phosphogluconolactonase